MQEIDKESSSSAAKEQIFLKVLVVEDDRNFRLMIQECMKGMEGFNVDKTFALDARAGLQKFHEILPDIVLLDINLPDGSGINLIKPMLQINPAVGIVMVTGSKLSSDVDKAKNHGAIGYILKPFTRKKIDDAFQVFLNYRKQLEESGDNILPTVPNNALKEIDFFISEEQESIKPPEEKQPERPSTAQVLSDWNILFADSYLTNLESAERHLKKFCSHLDIASSAEEFKRCVSETEYQCILIDPIFPDGNGYLLINELKRRYHQQPIKPYIIALMQNSDELANKKWLEAGMNDYLMKPCAFKEIEGKLKKFAQIYIDENNEEYLP